MVGEEGRGEDSLNQSVSIPEIISNQFSLICMASLLTERCYRSTPRGVLTAHAWWLCQCETGACQYHWCSIYRGLERVGSWVPGGSVGRDQLAMAAKVRRHWFNPCRLGSRGHLDADFSLLLYTDLIKKRKPSRYFTDEGELIREYVLYKASSINCVLCPGVRITPKG